MSYLVCFPPEEPLAHPTLNVLSCWWLSFASAVGVDNSLSLPHRRQSTVFLLRTRPPKQCQCYSKFVQHLAKSSEQLYRHFYSKYPKNLKAVLFSVETDSKCLLLFKCVAITHPQWPPRGQPLTVWYIAQLKLNRVNPLSHACLTLYQLQAYVVQGRGLHSDETKHKGWNQIQGLDAHGGNLNVLLCNTCMYYTLYVCVGQAGSFVCPGKDEA